MMYYLCKVNYSETNPGTKKAYIRAYQTETGNWVTSAYRCYSTNSRKIDSIEPLFEISKSDYMSDMFIEGRLLREKGLSY